MYVQLNVLLEVVLGYTEILAA